ncbi:MAG: hypothetical protein P8189_31080, partial [Anaerolineae bacterium]
LSDTGRPGTARTSSLQSLPQGRVVGGDGLGGGDGHGHALAGDIGHVHPAATPPEPAATL